MLSKSEHLFYAHVFSNTYLWFIDGSREACPAHAPLRVQILSFRHTKFSKCNRFWSRRPLRGRRPLGKSWIRHCDLITPVNYHRAIIVCEEYIIFFIILGLFSAFSMQYLATIGVYFNDICNLQFTRRLVKQNGAASKVTNHSLPSMSTCKQEIHNDSDWNPLVEVQNMGYQWLHKLTSVH